MLLFMAASCRFAFAVHILSVLAYQRQGDISSDVLARSVNTNAVVIRRILGDLRAAGLIVTQRGKSGGARLSRPPEEMPLDLVYRAIQGGQRLSLHPQGPNPECPVGRKIQDVLAEVFTAAQEALERELARRTVADVLDEVAADGVLRGTRAHPGTLT